jgi:hypothetical protein
MLSILVDERDSGRTIACTQAWQFSGGKHTVKEQCGYEEREAGTRGWLQEHGSP